MVFNAAKEKRQQMYVRRHMRLNMFVIRTMNANTTVYVEKGNEGRVEQL